MLSNVVLDRIACCDVGNGRVREVVAGTVGSFRVVPGDPRFVCYRKQVIRVPMLPEPLSTRTHQVR